MFFNSALVITAASMVIYTYGLLSPSTAIAFFSISLCTLALTARKLNLNINNKGEFIQASENRHFFSGHYFRTYTDAHGAIWIRDTDIRRCIHTAKPAVFLARKYPQYFCKANPVIDAWYIHPKALRALTGNNPDESDLSIIHFLEKQVIGVHYGMLAIGGEKNRIPEPVATVKNSWPIRFWNGEIGLITTIISGGTLAYLTHIIFGFMNPAEFVLHYQKAGIVYLAGVITSGLLMFCWGHAIILATQHWIASGRSILMAFASIAVGVYLVTLSLDSFVKQYNQYSLVEWLGIITDKDETASVYYDPQSKATIINGDLGFGTTIKFLDALQKTPPAKLIGLKSYGGRAAEGEAIYRIIRERHLDTIVWSECMSACVIAYAAGENRYITNTARFGLHRSGFHWYKKDDGFNETDRFIADVLRKAGVQESMIARGLRPTIHDIYLPSAQEVLDAHLATGLFRQ